MLKKILAAALVAACTFPAAHAARYNAEKTVSVGGVNRKYVLYVPDNVQQNTPLVFSLHGAAGHDTDRSPFRTDVADQKGCIVVYPQGQDQFFPVFGGYIPGWNASGVANEDLDFFKAIIEQVAAQYSIDRSRVYCCGFSNGGMMTYSNAGAAADIFAAFASISGFQLNEFHHRPTGARPVPFLHIHGKADDFVKYSCMPVIRDNMVARNGCNPVPAQTVVSGKFRKSVFEAEDGGFPYVYYEIDGMGHNDFTPNTEEGNSALTMWNFMSQYRLDDPCDPTLKWRLNIDREGFKPRSRHWKVSSDGLRYVYGTPKKDNNADNNVYPSVQFEAGDYVLRLSADGDDCDKVWVQLRELGTDRVIFSMSAPAGCDAVMPFSLPAYKECELTIVKSDKDVKLTAFAFHSVEAPAQAVNSADEALPAEGPEPDPEPETGTLIEMPQDQGRQYDDFQRAAVTPGDSYTTYTVTSDLTIAFKMMNIDVAGCDYVVVKFAEPVASGWNLAFWSGTELVAVPAGSTEYRHEFDESVMDSGILPQICMMTFFGGYTAPLTAKVTGVYKHSTAPGGIASAAGENAVEVGRYNLGGMQVGSDAPGVHIVRYSDGTTRKEACPRR